MLRRLPPVCQWHGPFLEDIAVGQIDQFVKCVVCREDTFGLCYFTDMPVVALNGIGGVDDLTDGRSIKKIATQQLPFVSPRLDDDGIQTAPLLLKIVELHLLFLFRVSGIDQLQILEEFFLIFTSNILHGLAYLMDDTQLHVRIGEYAPNGIGKA